MISMGAMKIDDHWRAIGTDDKPIPGLYVVGVDAGGMWGDDHVRGRRRTPWALAIVPRVRRW